MNHCAMETLLENAEKTKNLTIYDSFVKLHSKIESNKNILCFVSGGADSDIMIDMISKIDRQKKVKFIFFDTGIEYQATKEHLDYLEKKYDIKIERVKAVVPVPLGCRKHGVPFWSKYVSERIERLQRHGFKWEDRPFDELIKEYPKCRASLRWWCNDFAETVSKGGTPTKSKFNINHVNGLKEYMVENPPTFRISPKCCDGAKKKNAKVYLKAHGADLNMIGIRKSEGGIRSAAYKSCFDPAKEGESWDNYRPIFWYLDGDRKQYEEFYGVKHSDCYVLYGLIRTGCAGCPFGKNFEYELEVIKQYEPKLYGAVNKIFGDSYEYTRNFLKFRKSLKERARQCTN